MRQVLFVTNAYHSPLYIELQQGYDIRAFGMATNLRTAAAMLQNNGGQLPDVVLLGHDLSPPDKTVAFIRKAMRMSPLRDLTWIVLIDQNIIFTAADLSGLAKTFVFQKVTVNDLAAAIGGNPLKTEHSVALAIVNTKGGTGKTSVVVNLADNLARKGLRVALVDADVADGNVSMALKLPPSALSIDDLARKISRGEDAYQIIQNYLYEYSHNLFVMPAPDRRDYEHDYLNEMTAAAIFNAIKDERFEVILMDLPGNVRATPFIPVLAANSDAYFYLLYPVNQTFGIGGFKGAAEIISGLNIRDRARMIVIETTNESRRWSEAELQRDWQMPLAGVLPYDPAVERSQLAGQTVAEYVESSKKGMLSKLAGSNRFLNEIDRLSDWFAENDLGLSKS